MALITLDREASRNAVDSVMSRELPQAWAAFENDPDARVAIITGRGDRIFCAGADLINPPPLDGEGPLWLQIRRAIAQAILSGEWTAGTRIPAELVEAESRLLWRREMIHGSYCPAMMAP